MLDKTKIVENVKNDKCGDVWFHELGRAYRVGIHCSTAAYWPRHARRRHLTSRRLRNSFFPPLFYSRGLLWKNNGVNVCRGVIAAHVPAPSLHLSLASSLQLSRGKCHTCPRSHRYTCPETTATTSRSNRYICPEIIATTVPE
ncbi:hypothetical protein BgiMline_033470 [Biomphalaria glabrata]|nr:hypothetical protein BgiMline_024572 [Biomphalaria glabrata]